MPPTPVLGVTFAPGGAPASSFVYSDPDGVSGKWHITTTGGIALYNDAGLTRSDVLSYVGREATAQVLGFTKTYSIDGWIYAATDSGTGNPTGHWIFSAQRIPTPGFPGVYYMVGFNSDPPGTPLATMQFAGWPHYAHRT